MSTFAFANIFYHCPILWTLFGGKLLLLVAHAYSA